MEIICPNGKNFLKETDMSKNRVKFYVNTVNGDRWICPNDRVVKTIDGVDYIGVYKETNPNIRFMRRDVLKPLTMPQVK